VTFDPAAALEILRHGEEHARRRVVAELAGSERREAIAPLLVAVGDESWAVRQAAVEGLARLTLDALLPTLEAALRDGDDAGSRNAAMEIYVRLGESVVRPLLTLASDPDEEVRLFACVMLGSIKNEAAVPGLVAALADPDTNVRHAAATSLGQIGSQAAVPRLVEALRGEPWLQYPALHALGEIADPRAAPALVALLDDDLLRGPALDALARLAGRDALPRIARHLLDPDPGLRNSAIRAVVEIEQRATASGESLDPEVQATLKREELVTHLVSMLADEDPRNRRTAAVTLGWLREGRATAPLLELLADAAVREFASHALVSIGLQDRGLWQRGLAHADDAVRLGTLRCLAWIAPPEGTALAAPLIHDPSAEVRAEAAAAIGQLGDEDAPMLLFELLGDESELIQESAMEGLARMSPARVLPLLLQALASGETDSRVRAAQTLGLLQDPAAQPALVTASRDEREAVRAAAVQALGELGGPETLEVLRASLADASSLVRQQAVLALGRLREPESAPLLLPLVSAEDPRLRFAAVRALGQIRSPIAIPRLLPLLGDARKELRFAAVEALGQIRAPEAVAPLVAALREPDRNLRRAAAEGLGEIADPRSAPDLLVALEDEHWSVRSAAATALGKVASPKATLALVARADDSDDTVRRAAVLALGELRDPRAAPRLVEALSDPALQAAARESLRKLGPQVLAEMEQAMRRGGVSADARKLLVDLAGRFEDPAARRLLLLGLEDESPAVRAEAAAALGDGGFREALRPLVDRKASDPSPEVRQAAATALRKLQPR
jgi:HEAT repeat protein